MNFLKAARVALSFIKLPVRSAANTRSSLMLATELMPLSGNFDLAGRNAFCHPRAAFNHLPQSFQVAVVNAYQFCFVTNMFQLFFGM